MTTCWHLAPIISYQGMSIIPTVSVEEAGVALGLGPVSIRQRIKTEVLSAARVGRAWRVHVDSINAILSGRAPTNSSVAAKPNDDSTTVNLQSPVKPPAITTQEESPRTCTASDAGAGHVPNDPSVLDQPARAATITALPEAEKPAAPKPRFSDSDMVWINRYRREALDPDREVAANARWQLEQFERRANENARWGQNPPSVQLLGTNSPLNVLVGAPWKTRKAIF